MPKETEGAPEPPENTPDGQEEAPDQSQEPIQPEHPPAHDADDAERQALGQTEKPKPSDGEDSPGDVESASQYTDDPDYLGTSDLPLSGGEFEIAQFLLHVPPSQVSRISII